MAFFDKIKNILTDNHEEESNRPNIEQDDQFNKDKQKSTVDKVIEKSLWGVKKYYELKVNMVNQITDIYPEWEFYDETIQKRIVEEAKLEANNLEDKKVNISININNLSEDLKKYKYEFDLNTANINKSKSELYNVEGYNERKLLENKINKLEQKNKQLNLNIKNIKNDIENHKNYIKILENKISEAQFSVITKLSFIKNSYTECNNIASKYNISNNFVNLAMPAIQYYEENNIELAISYVTKYFNEEINNINTIHNPILDGLYSKVLVSQGNLQEAKVLLDYVLKYYPDSIELHKMLKEIHRGLGEYVEEDLEEKIINMLS